MGFILGFIFGLMVCVLFMRRRPKYSKSNLDNNHDYPYLGLVSVTDHFGYTYESYNGKWQHVIWRIRNNKTDYIITCVETRTDAIQECKYLEKLIND